MDLSELRKTHNLHTFARSARAKVLLSARWALLSQTGSLLMKLLPGNLAENVVGDQRFNFFLLQ
jgi:hypothetical protein